MRSTALAALLFLTACSSYGPANRPAYKHVTLDSMKAPATELPQGPAAIAHLADAKITAYRLDRIEEPKPGEGFHGHAIVGTRVVQDAELRAKILKALTKPYNYNEVYRHDGQPTLGFRVEHESTVTDFVICTPGKRIRSYGAMDAGTHGLTRVGAEVFTELDAELAGALAMSAQP